MEDKVILPTMEVIEGKPYTAPRDSKGPWYDFVTRNNYVRFRWSTGFLVMQMYEFEKSKKTQKLILDTILGKEKKAKSKKARGK